MNILDFIDAYNFEASVIQSLDETAKPTDDYRVYLCYEKDKKICEQTLLNLTKSDVHCLIAQLENLTEALQKDF